MFVNRIINVKGFMDYFEECGLSATIGLLNAFIFIVCLVYTKPLEEPTTTTTTIIEPRTINVSKLMKINNQIKVRPLDRTQH